jgi:quercetin dioxygenase-like cupin family protein
VKSVCSTEKLQAETGGNPRPESVRREIKLKIVNYFPGSEQEMINLGKGVKRKITAWNEHLMSVEVHFEKGAVGELHSHPHEQVTYVVSGEFEFNVGGDKKILRAGDSVYEQSDIVHGVVCLKAGLLLDVFTPCRRDFLN